MKDSFTDEEAGIIIYEAMRAMVALRSGVPVEDSQDPHWEDMDAIDREDIGEQLASSVRRMRSGMPIEQIHELWCDEARSEGWSYGPAQDAELGTDPRIVKWDDLPFEDKHQIEVSLAIIKALG